jgi:hypothetical protein
MLNNNPLLASTAASRTLDDDPTQQVFVWRKKVEKDAEAGLRTDVSADAYQTKLIANQAAIVKLQERRVERERERAENERFREQVTRDLDMEANLGWDSKEEEFHRLQALRRSEIRMKEGRERVVDLLAKNVHIKMLLDDPEAAAKAGLALGESQREVRAREQFVAALEVDLTAPPQLVAGLTSAQLLPLLEDVGQMCGLGGGEPWMAKYWGYLRVVCARQLAVAQWLDHRSPTAAAAAAAAATSPGAASTAAGVAPALVSPSERAAAVTAVVAAEARVRPATAATVTALLARKSLAAIVALEKEVTARLNERQSNSTDAGAGAGPTHAGASGESDELYWEAVSSELRVAHAHAWLTAFHRCLLRQRVRQLRLRAEAEEHAQMREAIAAGTGPTAFGSAGAGTGAGAGAVAAAATAAAAGAILGASDSRGAASVAVAAAEAAEADSGAAMSAGEDGHDGGSTATSLPQALATDDADTATSATTAAAAAAAAAETVEARAAAEAEVAELAALSRADAERFAAILALARPPAPAPVAAAALAPAQRAAVASAAAAAAELTAQRAAVLRERAEEAEARLLESRRALQAKQEALARSARATVRADGSVDLFGVSPGATASDAVAVAAAAAAEARGEGVATGLPPTGAAAGAGGGAAASDSKAGWAEAFEALAREPGAADEEAGGADGGEVSLQPRRYEWLDRYRPRKPRYFNKVKTGFDWNKYNQSHYDKENPPPKVVQGYRFNLFYPDLINPREAPTYRIEKDPEGNPDYCVIRFSAGAPYEDVAFKIVRGTWNTAARHGFKCVFQRGALSLWFNFKRVHYRR